MADVAVVILTYNEELHIARALESVRAFAGEIFVIDSFSTDGTVDIARQYGAQVLQNPFVNQAKQFQWALDSAPTTAAWILRLDADEIIEPELAREIEAKLPTLPATVTGVHLKRKHVFMGRWIRHGGRYPVTLLRLWRRGCGRVEDRWMDEHVLLLHGGSVVFDGDFADVNLNDLTYFTDKHNRYATREALEVVKGKYLDAPPEAAAGLGGQARLKRFLKDSIYNRLPYWLSASGYFLYRYILRAGFLDGREGLIYHFLQGFWYRFLVGAKTLELENAIAGLTERSRIIETLSQRTGYALEIT